MDEDEMLLNSYKNSLYRIAAFIMLILDLGFAICDEQRLESGRHVFLTCWCFSSICGFFAALIVAYRLGM
jgi:hypothetical protein